MGESDQDKPQTLSFPAQVWRNGNSLVITIRRRVAEALGLREGDIVIVTITRPGVDAA